MGGGGSSYGGGNYWGGGMPLGGGQPYDLSQAYGRMFGGAGAQGNFWSGGAPLAGSNPPLQGMPPAKAQPTQDAGWTPITGNPQVFYPSAPFMQGGQPYKMF